MTAPRTVLVINPRSQNGALGRKWPELASTVQREFGAFEQVRTEGPGDATRLTREALRSGATCVTAIGGDGTINEVVNGFFDDGEPIAPDARLGILPFGTGGDLVKTLDIPNDIAEAARILKRGHTRTIDVGKLDFTTRDGDAGTRMFINIASFGISGLVDRLVNESSKRLGGKLSFFLATARATLRYTNQRVQLVFDDDPSQAVAMTINTVAVANGRYFGGGMFIAPDAELDDGFFDVVALGDLTRTDMLFNSRRLYAGTHLSMDKVSHRRAKQICAQPIGDDIVELDVDGETPGVLPATFAVVPGAIAVTVPD